MHEQSYLGVVLRQSESSRACTEKATDDMNVKMLQVTTKKKDLLLGLEFVARHNLTQIQ